MSTEAERPPVPDFPDDAPLRPPPAPKPPAPRSRLGDFLPPAPADVDTRSLRRDAPGPAEDSAPGRAGRVPGGAADDPRAARRERPHSGGAVPGRPERAPGPPPHAERAPDGLRGAGGPSLPGNAPADVDTRVLRRDVPARTEPRAGQPPRPSAATRRTDGSLPSARRAEGPLPAPPQRPPGVPPRPDGPAVRPASGGAPPPRSPGTPRPRTDERPRHAPAVPHPRPGAYPPAAAPGPYPLNGVTSGGGGLNDRTFNDRTFNDRTPDGRTFNDPAFDGGTFAPRPSGAWPPPEHPAETTVRLRPVRTRRPVRTAGALVCAVLGLGLIGGAATGSWLTGDSNADTTADTAYAKARSQWHSAPVDTLFPRTLDGRGAGPGDADRVWTRVAVAPDATCASALDPLLVTTLQPVGCARVLRATYTDATSSHVTTVGMVFAKGDAADMRALRTRFAAEKLAERPDLMPRPFSAAGTVAARFGDRQRASWTVEVLTDLPVVVYSVSGFADGRTVGAPQPAARAQDKKATSAPAQAGLGHEAKGLADGVERVLRASLAPATDRPT
ncbi:hypothetical protein [Streptomyces jumonjinensis]|uniref:hypothetical protein n=1 Tax=Streptomyces jumonjinensis TaxID=1945 RepID=UPI0037B13947